MSSITPEVLTVDVGAGELGVVRWNGRPGSPVVFAIHGLTANAWSWSVVARHLEGRASLVAVDLRGRGLSDGVGGPFGIRQHADDVAEVIRCMNASPAVVAGHSMGAFVALAAAERHTPDVADIVLVDGGPPVSVPADAAPERQLDELLGPSIARLGRVWPDRVTYRSMWNEHPAFEGLMNPDVERYVLSDLVECPGGFRSRVSEEAARTDGTELLLDEELRNMLRRRSTPTVVIRADSGVDAAPPPLIDDDVVAALPQHLWSTVSDTNHYSILIGERGAAIVAAALLAAVG